MRIQHNIMAMSAYRNYTNNVSAMKKNLEKLSSGYKINRAGDDAAGLAISEKMRAQITGLETAQKNAKDGISLVQTAEGALTEVHDMLNRMVELATQSANGTYDNDTDRDQLQKEMDQLRAEINRIADSSNFNGIKLLDGSMNAGTVVGVETEAMDIEKLLPANDPTKNNEVGVKDGLTVVETAAAKGAGAKFDISLNGLQTISTTGTDGVFTLDIGGTALTVALASGENTAEDIAKAFATKFSAATAVAGGQFKIEAKGDTLKFSSDNKVTLDAGAKVTWSWSPDGGTTEAYADDGIAALDQNDGLVVYAAGDPSISPVATGVTVGVGSVSATVDTKSGIGWDSGAAAALASAAGVTSGEIKLSYTTASGWKLQVGSTALTAAAASGTIASGATSGDALEIDFGDGVKVTLTATGVSSSETLSASDYQTAFGTAQTIGTLGVESSGGTPSGGTPSATTVTGSDTISLPQLSGVTGDYGSATSATAVSAGDAAKLNDYFKTGAGSSITVDGKTVKLDSVSLTDSSTFGDLAKQIGAAVKAELAKDPDYTYTDITVQIGNDSPIAIQTAGDMPQITVGWTKTAKTGNTSGTQYHGVINSGLQNTDNGVDEGALMLANTNLTMKEDYFADGTQITIGNKTFTIVNGADSKFKGASDELDVTGLTLDQKVQLLANKANEGNENFSVGHDGAKLTLQQLNTDDNMETVAGIASYLGIKTAKAAEGKEIAVGKDLTLQIGDTAESFNKLTVSIKDMHADAMGIGSISIKDQESASAALDAIKSAINYVSDVRGTLGATQNRLDHTINNLSVMTENIQDAESTIRDVDVAEEMMAYTKNNILIQSAQAMLAQANQVPQGVLQLLG